MVTEVTALRDELEGVDLGDERLNRRVVKVLENLAINPQASVNAAHQGWSETQAAYRLFDNERVSQEQILEPHREATLERIAQHPVVLIAQDTTELDFTPHAPRGAGPLTSPNRRGFLDHTSLAMTPQRLPLGVVDFDLYARSDEGFGESKKRQYEPLETKETFRWLQGYRQACAVARAVPETQVVSVADCEGDLYEVFLEAQQAGGEAEYVVRAGKNRSLTERDPEAGDAAYVKLRDAIAEAPALGNEQLELGRTPQRKARTAPVEIRAQAVQIKAPYRRHERLPNLTLNVVWVREVDPPEGVEPLDWLLITSLPIDSLEQVLQVVDYYAVRWTIEVYFRVLKTGCRVEEIQLETEARLRPCLMLYRIIAWRVLYLTILGRECPDLPCDVVFTAAEWMAVYRIVRQSDPPEDPPPLSEFLRILAVLGGYNDRRNERPPGPQSIWIGLRRMTDFAQAWLTFGPATHRQTSYV